MSKDFGHWHASGKGHHMDGWGAGPFVIETAEGRLYRFEDSDRFGPSRVNKNGELAANPYFGELSPFWHAWHRWREQGRRLKDDGKTCIWEDKEPEPKAPAPAIKRGPQHEPETIILKVRRGFKL